MDVITEEVNTAKGIELVYIEWESRAMARRKQATFASVGFDVYRRASRRARFLAQIDRIMPWEELMAIVEPYNPKRGQRGRPVTPLQWMIKLYFIQIWFGLSDPQTEDIIHDSYAVERFLGLDLGRDRPPDETTILRFRHLIEEHKLGPKLLAVVNVYLHRQTLSKVLGGGEELPLGVS
jgi:hypothetical protein